MADHVATVLDMYQAFGRGDVPAILDHLADDVEWDHGVRDTGLPWLVPGRGKGHVAAFFSALGAGLEFTIFDPTTIAEAADTVVVVVREEARARATGRVVEEDLWVHLWTFGPDGKVAAFRHIGDFARQERAVAGG
jgi:uncharacterized protein